MITQFYMDFTSSPTRLVSKLHGIHRRESNLAVIFLRLMYT